MSISILKAKLPVHFKSLYKTTEFGKASYM